MQAVLNAVGLSIHDAHLQLTLQSTIRELEAQVLAYPELYYHRALLRALRRIYGSI